MIYDEPHEGPWAWEVLHCHSMLELDRGQLKWAKEHLEDEMITENARKLYEWISQDAQKWIAHTEAELESWRHTHFEWLRSTESA